MRSRRWLNLGLLMTSACSLLTGFLIQITYHMHHGAAVRATRMVWGLGYPAWALIHQIASALMLILAGWHIFLNRRPFFAWLKKRQNPGFVALFTLAVLSALAAWVAGKLFDSTMVERALVEVHDKLAIPLSVLLAWHIGRRRGRLLR